MARLSTVPVCSQMHLQDRKKAAESPMAFKQWIMRYSISNYSVMCVYCVFGKQEKVSQQEGSFVSTEGVSDWSNIGRLVKLHIYESPPTWRCYYGW